MIAAHADFDGCGNKYTQNVIYTHLFEQAISHTHLELGLTMKDTMKRYEIAYFHIKYKCIYMTKINAQTGTK